MCRAVPDHILLGTSDLDRGIAFVNGQTLQTGLRIGVRL